MEKITAKLEEYKLVRDELKHKMQAQYTLMTIMVTAIGILFAASMQLIEFESLLYKDEVLSLLFCAAIPGVVLFFGAIWLDQVYRQVMLGVYALLLEREINEMQEYRILYWENWATREANKKPLIKKSLDESSEKIGFFDKLSYFYYYICLGLFLSVPPFSAVIGYFVVEKNLAIMKVALIVGAIAYCAFCFFCFKYVTKILSLRDTQSIEQKDLSKAPVAEEGT